MTSIVYEQNGVTTISNPGSVVDITTPTVNTSRVVVFDKISGVMNGIADGTVGQFLSTNGTGGLSWVSGGGGGAVDIDGLTDGYKVGSRLVLGSTITPSGNNTTIISTIFTGTVSGTNNTFIGSINVPNIVGTALNNVIVGTGNYSAFTGAVNNCIMGFSNALNLVGGGANVIIGSGNCTAATGAANNVVIGTSNATAITNAVDNIIIGKSVGSSLTDGADNVLIGKIITAVGSRTGVIALGSTIVANVNNGFYITPGTATVDATKYILMNTATGQLGPNSNTVTQTITNNTAILITGIVHIITFAGPVTSIRLNDGTYNGQIAIVAIDPLATDTATLDLDPAVSRVFGSANASVNLYDATGTTSRVFTYIWSQTSSRWIPTVN
jgi:hypothetical protein